MRGTLRPPPDKSISHRAAIIAAMGEGRVEIERYLDAADTRSTLDLIAALGARVRATGRRGRLEVEVGGVGLRGAAAAGQLDVGNAGTLLRLVAGWLAGQEGREFVLDGDESIRRRPMERVAEPLRMMGAEVETTADGLPPARITGGRLSAIDYRLPVASAQVKSAVLLAGLLAEGTTTVHEPGPARDHTERLLRAAGASVEVRTRRSIPSEPSPATVSVRGLGDRALRLPALSVPGDLSSAAFPLAAALLVPGSAVRLEAVGLNPTRVGLLGILNRMQATVEVEELGHEAGEPVGAIVARHGELRGVRVGGAEVPLAIDELPLVGLLGCFAEGETVVSGAAELRHKESDRIATVVDGLRGLGGEVEATDDGFAVTGTGGLRGGAIRAHGDHRIAMLGAVAGLASRDGVTVEGIEAAAISYPDFERDLASLTG